MEEPHNKKGGTKKKDSGGGGTWGIAGQEAPAALAAGRLSGGH